jgi:hypothetical protein
MRRYRLFPLAVAVVLAAASSAGAKELKLGPLFAMCGAKDNQKAVFGCAAFTEGFVLGLAGAGVICPPPDAYKEVIAGLLTLSRPEIGESRVAEVLLPRLKAKYPCSGA